MKLLTDAEIYELINCPKMITEPPRKDLKLERGSLRNEMRLVSVKDQHEFTVFMRVNEHFRENFSIGMEYCPKDDPTSICLLRCNGPHGEFAGSEWLSDTHFSFHAHKATAENMARGRRPEHGGEATESYGSYEQALVYFLKVVNVINAAQHFPTGVQIPLDLGLEET